MQRRQGGHCVDDSNYRDVLSTLRNEIARDLWWVLASIPMLHDVPQFPQHTEGEQRDICRALLPFIRTIDAMSFEEASAAIGIDGWRVGLYFETLMAALIRAHPAWTLVGADVPIRQDGRTLGAFDFIVRTADGAYQHWEIAVKFYLLLGDPMHWNHWLGPNQRDRLDKKVNRMRHHQIPLSRRTAALEVLHAFGATSIEQHVALLKGIFFVEWGDRPIGPPHASMAPSGLWVCEGDVASVNHQFSDSAWIPRHKPFWLAPIASCADADVHDQLPKNVSRPQMWSRVHHINGQLEEAERWFVVPNRWKKGRRHAG